MRSSYQSKSSQQNKGSSIAKDEVALLAERLEFFVPKLIGMMALWQWLLYIFFWSLFVTVITRYDFLSSSEFTISFLIRLTQNVMTIVPILYLVDYLRPVLKRMSIVKASVYILLSTLVAYVVSSVSVMLVVTTIGWFDFNYQTFILNLLLYTTLSGAFTLVFLMYFLNRYRELVALKQAFEYELIAQNDLIKARLAPHFFFNTINSLLALIESDSTRAAELLQHVSALFRASFSGSREISFEEEIALSEHYLAIESYRLADKLVVTWQLPDDDVMYDMVITALTLQSIIEKVLIHVVEMTTETIHMHIDVTWEQHRVNIVVSAQLPIKTLMIIYDLRQQINFHVQAKHLQAYFGSTATITSVITKKQITTTINYPLQNVLI